jgi:Terminase large subunit, T4likevirus-type, N-terminal
MTAEYIITPSERQALAQQAVISQQYNFILFGGAMGGGKTFWGLSTLLALCEIFPKSRWCVIREDLEKIRTTTIPSFKKFFAPGKLRENPYHYTHPNGSVIMFKGENYAGDKDLQWLKGLEVNGFLFEEINECQQDTFELSFSRAGRWECQPFQPKPMILATCNPSTNWVKTLVYDCWKNGTLPENWLYIQSLITDNPYLTEGYKESLQNMPRFKYEVFVLGNWDIKLKTGGEFYKCFNLEKHVKLVKYNPDLPLHISWDDNVNPYLPCGIFQIEGKKLVMVDEIAGASPNNTITGVCNEIKRRYLGHQSGMFIYGDATANKEDTKLEKGYNFYRLITDALKDYHPANRVTASNPSVAARGMWINTVLEKEIGGIQVVIGEHCTNTINDFTMLKEAADGSKLKEMATNASTKVRYQKVGHFTDLTDYILCSAFQNDFLTYQRGGRVPLPTTGKNVSKNSY